MAFLDGREGLIMRFGDHGKRTAISKSRRARVILLNNYPMRDALDLVRSGEYPAQHLWGAWDPSSAGLRPGWKIPAWSYDSMRRFERLRRLLRLSQPLLGDLLQQLWVLLNARQGDIVYSADQQSAITLCILRRFKLFRIPIVMVIHNGPALAWASFWMQGLSRRIFLSEQVMTRFISTFGPTASTCHLLHWGPDTTSPIYQTVLRESIPVVRDFVAAGKTNRDFMPLVALAQEMNLSGAVLDGSSTLVISPGRLETTPGATPYIDTLRLVASSKFVVIPLKDRSRISGLTEIADAIALRRPVLVVNSEVLPANIPGVSVMPELTVEAMEDWLSLCNLLWAPPDTSPYTMDTYSAELEDLFDSLRSEDKNCEL